MGGNGKSTFVARRHGELATLPVLLQTKAMQSSEWLGYQTSPGLKRQFLQTSLIALLALESSGLALHDLGPTNAAVRGPADMAIPCWYDMASWAPGRPTSFWGFGTSTGNSLLSLSRRRLVVQWKCASIAVRGHE